MQTGLRLLALSTALTTLLPALPSVLAETKEPVVALKLISEEFDHLTAIAPLPNDPSHLLIAERSGRVVRFSKKDDSTEELCEIESLVNDKLTRGLLGVVTTPGASGQILINYVDTQGDLVVGRFPTKKEEELDENSMSVTIKVAHIARNSHGSALGFARDGALFISTGDGQAALGQINSHPAQSKSTLLGKVLRITPHDSSRYEIPSSNPFTNQTESLGEIWALGFRNPEQLSVDERNDRLFVIDNSDSVLEINLVQRGLNYGWDTAEGPQCRVPPCSTQGLTPPIISIPRTSPQSRLIAGGIYRGALLPHLSESFIFAESSRGALYAAREGQNQAWQYEQIASLDQKTITAIGKDSQGELYIATAEGSLFELKLPKT